MRALKATVDFRKGGEARAAAVTMAEGVVAEDPGSVPAQMVLVADRLAAGAPGEALARIDDALAHAPADEGLHLARLATLDVLGDTAGTGAELTQMAGLFPENAAVRAALVSWHLGQGDPDAAEAVLRAAAGRPGPAARRAAPGPALTLVRFLNEVRGPEAARAELDRLVAAAEDPAPFRRARAALDFAAGDTQAAIAAMRGLVEGAQPSDATRDSRSASPGCWPRPAPPPRRRGSSTRCSPRTATTSAALKLRAKLALDADRPEAAVQDMRTALAQAPADAEALTVMALAYERQGARELAGEQLARAVEASDRAPAESLRYAGFLMQDARTGPAEAVVVDALRRAPEDPELLGMLGEIHLARRDSPAPARWRGSSPPRRTRRRRRGRPGSRRRGSPARAAARRRSALLEELAGDGDAGAMAALVRARLEAGDAEGARGYLEGVLEDDPGNPVARLLVAGLDAAGATRPRPRPATGRWPPTLRTFPRASGPGRACSPAPGAAPRRRRRSTPGSRRTPATPT